jgi:predicted ribosome quality control (RQC) complex YloA/Tae2 family protein
MKIEKVFIDWLNYEFTFYIGTNQRENFEVIDLGEPNDLWFHANNISSCHVVCNISSFINEEKNTENLEKITKKEMNYIVKVGAFLCKKHTNKLKNMKNVEIMYTQIKNICKTKVDGCVTTQNVKKIIC